MKGFSVALFVLITITAALALVMQTTVFQFLPLIPDMLLILCVYLGLHQHSVGGSAGAFLLGYFNDSFSGNLVGLHAFAMSLVFILVYLVSKRLWMDNVVSNVAVVFVASVLKAATISALLAFYLSLDFPWSEFLSTVWFEAIAAALMAPLVFAMLDGGKRLWGID
ncbi:MAG: rod shape-determining protein MreD [Candidatus Binatota bacterium]|jgi:rod shape-determining protein MreD|nr:rod shape-determining protein MreD [Candidatus Binatota bacterium]